MKIILAQGNYLVGAIEENAQKIIQQALQARDQFQADAVVFPELALTAYPPEDLLMRPSLHQRCQLAMQKIIAAVPNIVIILGHPTLENHFVFNSLSILHQGQLSETYHKQILPNYSVFDEKRYFGPGKNPCVFSIANMPVGFLICEDIWFDQPAKQAAAAGAKLIVVINASPFDIHKKVQREKILQQRALEINLPIIYLNTIGGQDELVFDGGSFAVNKDGAKACQAPFFKECLFPIEIKDEKSPTITPQKIPPTPNQTEMIYQALTLGIQDYVNKNNFPGVIIGLSGGIDSALTLCLAVDALGKERVQVLLMPSRYTAQMSISDALEIANTLGVTHHILSIEPAYQAFLETLKSEFANYPMDSTEENIQARCRGILLMALSNKLGLMVLTTGNKSEMSVGYATLYGDMVGGFCAIKNVPKTMVYQLAHYRNQLSAVIPNRIIDRPPTAELAENQLDQDTLPPYPILDAILDRYIEHDQSPEEIIGEGFDSATVKKVIKMVDKNEYKRRQAAPGVRISERAFGRDRRYPITSGFSKI